jgi:hypothetical protein
MRGIDRDAIFWSGGYSGNVARKALLLCDKGTHECGPKRKTVTEERYQKRFSSEK